MVVTSGMVVVVDVRLGEVGVAAVEDEEGGEDDTVTAGVSPAHAAARKAAAPSKLKAVMAAALRRHVLSTPTFATPV